MVEGGKAFAKGLMSGAMGIVTKPLEGGAEGGLGGFLGGVAKVRWGRGRPKALWGFR